MCDILADPFKCDRRKNKTCIRCRRLKCADPDDEICRVCWDAGIEAANQTRRARIAAGWHVGPDGSVTPPNDPSSATRPASGHACNREVRAGFAAAHG